MTSGRNRAEREASVATCAQGGLPEADADIHSDMAIPPGEYLLEVLGEVGLTQEELADRAEYPHHVISGIANGRSGITADMALQLEQVLGVPAPVWRGLESDYQRACLRHGEITGHVQ